jgi:hypothetical protein
MLKSHFHAPDQTMTATELAKAAGYANYNATNLQYGKVGQMLYDVVPTKLIKRKNGTLVFTSALAEPGAKTAPEKEWQWKLRPAVATAIERLGLHT